MDCRNMFLIFFVFISIFELNAGEHPCNAKTEFPCDLKGCIYRFKWCDSVKDCYDGSDEAYCHGRAKCLVHHFQCNDGTCIPLSGRCDNITDCKDSSDEDCESTLSYLSDTSYSIQNRIPSEVNNAVTFASDWILNQRGNDFSWGDDTSRAIVALSFADEVRKMSEDDKNMLRKQLNINLSLELMRNRTMTRLTASKLSLYINALYATCQNPSNFQGIDLISKLRHQTDLAISEGNFSLPITILTLCLARQYEARDFMELHNLYWRLQSDKIGSKAIAVMAMSCLPKELGIENDKKRVFENFRALFNVVINKNDVDIYTKALYLQATVSIGFPIDGHALLKHRRSDGSFGDLLATYYVLPALVNSSLVSLMERCRNKTFEKLSLPYLQDSRGASKVYYSIWIDSSKGKNIHSIEVSFSGNKTLFDIMKSAESREETFRFQYDVTSDGGIKLYSLASIPDDAERGKFWFLYVGHDSILYSLKHFKEEKNDLNRIFPKNNQHFVFKLKSQ